MVLKLTKMRITKLTYLFMYQLYLRYEVEFLLKGLLIIKVSMSIFEEVSFV